jgi:NTP pyrophosphatase (non-canonical NTP hydrolase)
MINMYDCSRTAKEKADSAKNFPINKTPMTDVRNAVQLLSDTCFKASEEAKWWHDIDTGERLDRNKGEMMTLIHSEISEAYEGVRKNAMDDHLPHRKAEEVEMADALIRIFDYCGGHDLDVAGALVEKMAYNKQRQDHKVENRRKDGGKKT